MGSRTSERHVQQLKKLSVWPLLRLRVPSSKLLYCMHPETATNLSCVVFLDVLCCVVLCFVFVFWVSVKGCKNSSVVQLYLLSYMNFHFIQNVLGKACKSYTEMLYDNVNTKYFPASYYQYEAKVLPGRASMQVDEWQEYSQKKFHAKLEWLAHNSQKFSLISSKTSGKAQWVSS